MILTGTGKYKAESFDGIAAAAPLLHVEYRLQEEALQATGELVTTDGQLVIATDESTDRLRGGTTDPLVQPSTGSFDENPNAAPLPQIESTPSGAFPVQAADEPTTMTPALTVEQLDGIVDQAFARLTALIEFEQAMDLDNVEFNISDLPGDLLGQTTDNLITIDRDAAGYGWYVDSTPWDDFEFPIWDGSQELRAVPGSPAYGSVDLLTAVIHELGHFVGFDHTSPFKFMEDELPLGTRRVANEHPVFFVGRLFPTEHANRLRRLMEAADWYFLSTIFDLDP